MTIHRRMFDEPKKEECEMEELPTQHRVYVEFEGGYFVSFGGQDSDFQEMVTDFGRPVKVEFRATDEGWFQEGDLKNDE